VVLPTFGSLRRGSLLANGASASASDLAFNRPITGRLLLRRTALSRCASSPTRGAGLDPHGLRSLAQQIHAGSAGMNTKAADPVAGARARSTSWALRTQHASA